MNSAVRLSRSARSLLTLNRDREYALLKARLVLQPDDHLLDVGSGDGFWTARLARHCAHVTGLEPDGQGLAYANAFYARPNVNYVQGVAESMPFPDERFDKVVSISSFEHFVDPVQGLQEMHRVLKPGGRLAISVDSLLPENAPDAFRAWHKKRHFVTAYFSERALSTLFEEVGFRYEPARTSHLFRSSLAARVRQVFIRRPRVYLPLFPVFYGVVRLGDRFSNDMHGQILVVTATR